VEKVGIGLHSLSKIIFEKVKLGVVEKVYNAKNIFWIATLYQKKGRKITFDFENFEVNSISNGALGFQFDTCF
jgi:hypothetical protein